VVVAAEGAPSCDASGLVVWTEKEAVGTEALFVLSSRRPPARVQGCGVTGAAVVLMRAKT
jgi:hypothetical protein